MLVRPALTFRRSPASASHVMVMFCFLFSVFCLLNSDIDSLGGPSINKTVRGQCVLQKTAPLCGPMEKLHFANQGSENIYTASALWNAECCSICVDTLATIAKSLQLLLHKFPGLHSCHIFDHQVYLRELIIRSDQIRSVISGKNVNERVSENAVLCCFAH